jgi:NADH-quinone oxidoreductase subunit J
MLFILLRTLMEFTAVAVLIAANPIHAIFYLILLFIEATALLLWLGCEYLAMVFMIIYVGAIAVLFLFVIMMLNTRLLIMRELTVNYLPLGGVIVFVACAEFFTVLSANFTPAIVTSSSSDWIYPLQNSDNVILLGDIVYGPLVNSFILATLMLFVAMIGSIVLAFRKSTGTKRQNIFDQHNRKHSMAIRVV